MSWLPTSYSSHAAPFDRCRAFIDSNFVELHQRSSERVRPAVTFSRQPFAGTHRIAQSLLQLLENEERLPQGPWALFDRNLVHKVLEDHQLPKRLAEYMPEDKDHEVSGLINELLGLHPSLWELFHHTCDTVLKLARMGNVLLIGRGAHILTRHLPQVLKIRVVAPFDQRLERAAEEWELPLSRARRRLHQEDQARAAYIRSHFNESIDDPFAYHFTLNTEPFSPTEAARVIHQSLLACHNKAMSADSAS